MVDFTTCDRVEAMRMPQSSQGTSEAWHTKVTKVILMNEHLSTSNINE